MCVAIPMRVRQVSGAFAEVESGGLKRRVNIQMLAGLSAGDYILVHAGFAIQKLDPQKAQETLSLISDITLGRGGG